MMNALQIMAVIVDTQRQDYTLEIIILAGIIIGLGCLLFRPKRRCDWCEREYKDKSPGSIEDQGWHFCSTRHWLEFKDKMADVDHKVKTAGKGTQHTRIERKL